MDFYLDIKGAVEEKLDIQDKIKPEHSLVLLFDFCALNIWIWSNSRNFQSLLFLFIVTTKVGNLHIIK